MGLQIILHCFEYGNRLRQAADGNNTSDSLENYCERVYYYPRRTGWRGLYWKAYPYMVASRRNSSLLENLTADNQDNIPILFEGLHTCFYLTHKALKNRPKLVRIHNIEADYYRQLCQNEPLGVKKAYFYVEQYLLKRYEKVLAAADALLPIALPDAAYLAQHFEQKIRYVPAFHGNTIHDIGHEIGNFALYHGNLQVNENKLAALFLVEKVFTTIDYPLVIAGKINDTFLINKIKNSKNITLIPNPTQAVLDELLGKAQIQILPTFQNTGIKLKLINSLYNGRHCLVNTAMVAGTGLEPLCHIADTDDAFCQKIKYLSLLPFDHETALARRAFLQKNFDDKANAQKIIDCCK